MGFFDGLLDCLFSPRSQSSQGTTTPKTRYWNLGNGVFLESSQNPYTETDFAVMDADVARYEAMHPGKLARLLDQENLSTRVLRFSDSDSQESLTDG